MLAAIPYPPKNKAARPMRLLLPVLAAVLAPALAMAQATDPVVAKVGGALVYKSDVDRQAAELAQNMQGAPPSAIFRMARERVIDSHLIFAAAEAANFDQRPEFQRELARQRRTLLTQYYMIDYLQNRIDDARLKALYDETYPGGKGRLEIRASHILVADEAAARAVIAELDKGGDFAALAEQHSMGPSKSRGGDLGAFGKGAMIPTFEKALLALEPGRYTAEPVKTRFGWHIILLHGTGRPPAPDFAQVRGPLARGLSERILQEHLDTLRAGTEVVLLNPDGTAESQ